MIGAWFGIVSGLGTDDDQTSDEKTADEKTAEGAEKKAAAKKGDEKQAAEKKGDGKEAEDKKAGGSPPTEAKKEDEKAKTSLVDDSNKKSGGDEQKAPDEKKEEPKPAEDPMAADVQVYLFVLSFWFCSGPKYQNIIKLSKYQLHRRWLYDQGTNFHNFSEFCRGNRSSSRDQAISFKIPQNLVYILQILANIT